MRRPRENRLTRNEERLLGCHFAIEPRSSGSPVACASGGRKPQSLGSFFNRETGKKSKFNYPLLLRIQLSQFAQRIIERNHIKLHRHRRIEIIMKRYSQRIAAAFEPMARACMIDEQAPDHLAVSDPGKECCSPLSLEGPGILSRFIERRKIVLFP